MVTVLAIGKSINGKGQITMTYVEHVYRIVEMDCKDMDAIYRDYIIDLVGVTGLMALKEHRLIESCGVVNGRQLYTLCEPTFVRQTYF